MENTHGVFGAPPKELAPYFAQARQFSLLFPNSFPLERHPPATLIHFSALAPPGTLERRYLLALALRSLSEGGSLVALAPRDKGGSRIRKELEEFGCSVSEESKSHFKICHTHKSVGEKAENPAIRAAIEAGAPRRIHEIDLWSQPGVFSWDRIDPGSRMLVELLPQLSGKGADLGCGVGFLSIAALKSPKVTHITMIDIDRRAIDCARKNLETQIKRIHLCWADLRTADLPISSLDFIVTNPPFHDGGIEDQSLGQGFIQQAAFMLRPGGVCWLVANRHLPYESLLRSVFQEVILLKESGGYKAYKATR